MRRFLKRLATFACAQLLSFCGGWIGLEMLRIFGFTGYPNYFTIQEKYWAKLTAYCQSWDLLLDLSQRSSVSDIIDEILTIAFILMLGINGMIVFYVNLRNSRIWTMIIGSTFWTIWWTFYMNNSKLQVCYEFVTKSFENLSQIDMIEL